MINFLPHTTYFGESMKYKLGRRIKCICPITVSERNKNISKHLPLKYQANLNNF
jgi:hypothetical protein